MTAPSDLPGARLADIPPSWVEDPDLGGELADLRRIPGRGAITADLEPPLPSALQTRLEARNIGRLYRHQVQAISRLRAGRDTVITAGTASGKTLAYQLPVIEALISDPDATALLLYPTKALAHDQLRSFQAFELPEIRAATYDGDTPSDERARIRRRSNVVLTNPDMLHVGILPHHAGWADFLHRLRYVVVDEMHTLRGIFGTHVAFVLRRLRRLCAHYGSDPTFAFTSATIGNPGPLATALVGRPVEVVESDGSPRGEQWVASWNPPITDPDSGRRRSATAVATDLWVDLIRRGIPTIVFARSRKATELIYRWAADRLGDDRKDLIAPYRAGYLPAQRRAVERRLFGGELLGVVATTALELGIDVGGLDAAVLAGFPGTISAFRQQAGRAGRRRSDSLVILVAGEDALDQYFMAHPDELFTRSPEAVVVNPLNPFVLDAHVGCAAYELALTLDDRAFFGPELEEAVARLVTSGDLRLRGERVHWARRRRPARTVSIRTAGGRRYQIVADGRHLGDLDESRVFRDAHPGAVYLHQGDTYLVEELDIGRGEVRVRAHDVDFYTQPRQDQDLQILDVEASHGIGVAPWILGRVRVETQVVAYQRRRLGSGEVLDTIPLDLPPTSFETQGFWLVFTPATLRAARLDEAVVPGALHAAEHAMIAMLPLSAVCDRWDVGGLSTPWHPDTGEATIFVYEAYPGGAGISPVAFTAGRDLLAATVEAIRRCPCRAGCPSCVQSPKCGNFNEPLSKKGAIALLDTLLAGA